MRPRYNHFNRIHKALRTLLSETLIILQRTDFTDQTQKEQVLSQLDDTLTLFGMHADKEDAFILEPLATFNKQVAQSFEQEHIEDHKLAEKLKMSVKNVAAASNDKINHESTQLLYTFIEFTAFNLTHMNKEELILNEILWANYSDAEIKKIEGALVTTIPPHVIKISAKWMMRALSDKEIIEWLTEVKAVAPPPVIDVLLSTAKNELNSNRFNNLTKGLI